MIIHIDNIKSRIILEQEETNDLIQLVRDYLSIEDKKAKRYGSVFDNGMRYFCTPRGVFPTGYIEMVLKMLKREEISVTLKDDRVFPELDLDYDGSVGDYTLYDEQFEIVSNCISNQFKHEGVYYYNPRGLVDAATNAGKSLVVCGIHFSFVGVKTLLIIPNKQVYQNSLTFFKEVFGNDLGEITSKKCKITDFTLAMPKSLHNKIKRKQIKIKDYFDILLWDECHLAASDDNITLATKINAPVRIYLSGTPLEMESDIKKLKLYGLSGRVLDKITNRTLIDLGRSLEPIIHMIAIKDVTPMSDYREAYRQKIMFNKRMVQHMADIIMYKYGEPIMITFEQLKQGLFILEHLRNDLRLEGLVIEINHGKDSWRFDKEKRFAAGKIDVYITSMISKIGLNIKIIRNLILGNGGKSKITVKQIIGRAIRKEEGQTTVDVFDFFLLDNKWLSKHSRARIKTYKKETFKIKCLNYKANRYGTPIRFIETGENIFESNLALL